MGAHVKCAVLGGPYVGKTSCIQSYINNKSLLKKFEGEDIVIDYFSTSVKLDNGKEANLHIWDPGRSEGSERARISAYSQTDVIIIMFDVIRRDTLLDVEHFWFREVNGHCPNTPLILVGTKVDLRKDKRYRKNATSYDDGISLALKIKARGYLECSSKTLNGINTVFEEAVLAVLDPSKSRINQKQREKYEITPRQSCCIIF